MTPMDPKRFSKAWLLNEFVIRCMRCMWLFRSHERYRTCCKACESRKGAGGT